MRTGRGLVGIVASAVLASGLAVGAPAQAVPAPASGTVHGSPLSVGGSVPASALVGAAATVQVGVPRALAWVDGQWDAGLGARVWVLDIVGATAGADYAASLSGAGPVQLDVVDASGDVVAFASHPDAATQAPTLEWHHVAGDRVVAISDDLPLDAPSATLSVTSYTGTGVVQAGARSFWTKPTAGTVDPADPHVPFQGSHVDALLVPPPEAAPDQVVHLHLTSTIPDPVVIVLDPAGKVVDGAPFDGGDLEFPLGEGEMVAITSALPDGFGDYALDWRFLPGPARPIGAAVCDGGSAYVSYVDLPEISPAGVQSLDQVLEYSGDGVTWTAAPPGAGSSNWRAYEVLDGTWTFRLSAQWEGQRLVSSTWPPVTCSGDVAGWTTTGLELGPLGNTWMPGQPDERRYLQGAVLLHQVYRDGRTRTVHTDSFFYTVEFRAAGQSTWQVLATDWPIVTLPGQGAIRIVARDGMTSAAVEVHPVASTSRLRATFDTPVRSTTGGFMEFHGTVEQRWADGSWRPALTGTLARVQYRRDGRWHTVYEGEIGAGLNGAGNIRATVQMRGTARYRVRSRGQVVAHWTLHPATPTRTATIEAPNVRLSTLKGYAYIDIVVHQRYTDGRDGPFAPSGWMVRVRHRPAGSTKWRTLDRHTLEPVDHGRIPYHGAHGDWRIVGTYRGRTYKSPVTTI